MMILEPVKIAELNLLDRSRLFRNSEPGGSMRTFLAEKDAELYHDTLVIVRGVISESNQNILAWSYLYDSGIVSGSVEIGVYVNVRHRGKGFAKNILKNAMGIHKSLDFPKGLVARPWNLAGRRLFESLEIRNLNYGII